MTSWQSRKDLIPSQMSFFPVNPKPTVGFGKSGIDLSFCLLLEHGFDWIVVPLFSATPISTLSLTGPVFGAATFGAPKPTTPTLGGDVKTTSTSAFGFGATSGGTWRGHATY